MAMKIGMKAAHPGGFVRDWILPEGMSVGAAAEHLGVGRQALDAVLNERAALTPEMALRLQIAFDAPMDTLMRMQVRYDSERARDQRATIAASVRPYRPRKTATDKQAAVKVRAARAKPRAVASARPRG